MSGGNVQDQVNYWRQTVSRRGILRGATVGGLGLAGAALIGCSSSAKPAAPAASVASATAVAAASKPKPGGTLKYAVPKDPDSLDPFRSGGSTYYPLVANVYSRLFTFDPGDGGPASGKVSGDLAKTWEQPDAQTIIVHLNPAAKFDKKDPLYGRKVTSADVLASWAKFSKDSVYRVDLSNAANKDAPFDTVEAVDDSTVKFKLKFPDATALSLLGWYEFWVEPTEGLSGKIDLSKEARGSGPFLLDSYKPSVNLVYKKNPDWFGGPDKPYIDGINISILPDQAQIETQFRAKNLHFGAVSPPNIPAFAKELKDTEIVKTGAPSGSPGWGMSFLPGQPWNDVRVRRAVSMGLDRDAFVKVLYDPAPLEAAGVKVNSYWNAPFAAGYGSYWLDPKGSEFGPAAQYLKLNQAEATKMLQAAGFDSAKPLTFDMVFAGTYYGTDYPTRAETWQSMLSKIGVKVNLTSVDYATDYVPKYFRAKAEFKGKTADAAVQYPPGGTAPDPILFYYKYLAQGGASSMTGKYFPAIDDQLNKIRSMTDFNTRLAAVKELQRYTIDNMAVIPTGPATDTVDLVWKALRGPQQYQAWLSSANGTSSTSIMFPNYYFQSDI